MVVLAIGGIRVISDRSGGDVAVSEPDSVTISPPTVGGDACSRSGESDGDATVTSPSAHPCGWMSAGLVNDVNRHCLTGVEASEAASQILARQGLLGTWSVVQLPEDYGCAAAWVEVEARQVVVGLTESCPAVEREPDGGDLTRCAEVAERLRTEVNGHCLTAEAATAEARVIVESVGAVGEWTVITNETELCALAWINASLTVTIDDVPP